MALSNKTIYLLAASMSRKSGMILTPTQFWKEQRSSGCSPEKYLESLSEGNYSVACPICGKTTSPYVGGEPCTCEFDY